MSVMIWDSTSQAFVEARTPMVYDTENQAWRETVGLAWDEQNQAWVEKWSADNKVKSSDYNFFHITEQSSPTTASYSEDSNGVLLTCNKSYGHYTSVAEMAVSKKSYDLSKYSKAIVNITEIQHNISNGFGVGFGFRNKNTASELYNQFLTPSLKYYQLIASDSVGWIELDISNVSDIGYFFFYAHGVNNGSNSGVCNIRVKSFKLV